MLFHLSIFLPIISLSPIPFHLQQYPHPVNHHSTIHLQITDQPLIPSLSFLFILVLSGVPSPSGPLMPILSSASIPHMRLCPLISLVVWSYHFRYGALPPTHWPIGHPSKPLVWHPTLPGLGATVFSSQYANFLLYSLFSSVYSMLLIFTHLRSTNPTTLVCQHY